VEISSVRQKVNGSSRKLPHKQAGDVRSDLMSKDMPLIIFCFCSRSCLIQLTATTHCNTFAISVATKIS